MEEIIENVYYEIKNSGFEKLLIGGIVVTGGGSQLKHITQLFEYITGMDTRIGYPTEHLAKVDKIDVTSPTFATGIGLVIKGFESFEKQKRQIKTVNHSKKFKSKFLDFFKEKGQQFFDSDID